MLLKPVENTICGIYSAVKDIGNTFLFAHGIAAKEGEQPVSERIGYKKGDYIHCLSLGYSFNRIYLGNDRWYDDNAPDEILLATLSNGSLSFSSIDEEN